MIGVLLTGSNLINGYSITFSGFSSIGLILQYILSTSIGEELGWRGLMLTNLQNKYSIIKSSVIIGLIWELWHLPLRIMLIDKNSIQMFVGSYICAIISTVSLSIILAYLCNRTNGSIVSACIIHSIFKCSLAIILPSSNGFVSYCYLAIISIVLLLFVIIKVIKNPDYQNS